MRITPLDVRKQEFRKGMRGLDPEEVYAFLSTVADEYESVLNDNKALRERLLELDDKVQEYRTLEKTLRDTLLTAERVNAEAKDNARREANIIIKEAQIEAEKALRDIKTEAMKLRSQVQQLRSQREAYLARMKVVAESHLSYIDSAVDDFNKEDRAVVDSDVSEEQLADAPVDDSIALADKPVPEEAAAESNLFTAAKEAAPSDAPVATPSAPSPAVTPAAPVQPAQTRPVDRTAGLATGGVDPISVIIDRMKKGQQEILSSGAGTPGFPGSPKPASRPVVARSSEETAPSSTALGPSPGERHDADEAVEVEVTGEFNLDEIRRELKEEEQEC